MKDSYKDGIIYSNTEISPNIYEIVLEGEFKGLPGQFYMIRGWNGLDPFLPRPISIADLDNGKIKFLYEVRGRGTHIISRLKKGDRLSVLGPLGNGFNLEVQGKIALLSGGIGIAPMLYLAKNLSGEVTIYSGFRNNAYFLDQIKPYVKNIFIATEDGSNGHKGFVTELFDPSKYDLVLTCGPTPMMEVVIKMCEGQVPVYVSMESRMACGIGACLGCTIETIRGMERVCKEGPVFKGEEVVLHD
ncbi:dihydroorotate oxidase B, electron transfer subunit [Tissierella praeacuta DSM 18095]|uniref:Dihydroorotate dehydrogenase B (NAD(+)), electron transfer subunit n=1 Tax=Tissierella praeacuta DSM 18095 TaxID=1123404 RepID=A0A1M4V8R9_9FIRM|nr:dihydroorotate dehydrogenase electron transfer subunit [Tissierella praeacuta]SHE65354.1 dihydroorotate oxidase B, electron transfer subunit [Tissierella praeacuta DSM 18095]SUP03038.1 Dihydrdoorotate oxidase B, electron transfer subunit [Tissierella praeacuta]